MNFGNGARKEGLVSFSKKEGKKVSKNTKTKRRTVYIRKPGPPAWVSPWPDDPIVKFTVAIPKTLYRYLKHSQNKGSYNITLGQVVTEALIKGTGITITDCQTTKNE